MKRSIGILLLVVFLCCGTAWGEWKILPQEEGPLSICPKTLMAERCFSCHVVPNWGIKESDPHDKYDYPLDFKFIFDEKNRPLKGYMQVFDIYSSRLPPVIDYCKRHKVNHLIMEVYSPGGSLAEAWRMVGMMQEWGKQGAIVETRSYGVAFSAGFLLLASGTQGHRFVSPRAEFMWHELYQITWISIETPSKKEDEAAILRHWQNNVNEYLAEVSHLTKEELDKQIHRKEFWVNGKEMVEFGFADGLL